MAAPKTRGVLLSVSSEGTSLWDVNGERVNVTLTDADYADLKALSRMFGAAPMSHGWVKGSGEGWNDCARRLVREVIECRREPIRPRYKFDGVQFIPNDYIGPREDDQDDQDDQDETPRRVKPRPTTDDADAAAKIRDALETLGIGGKVNPEDVAAMVREEIARQADAMRAELMRPIHRTILVDGLKVGKIEEHCHPLFDDVAQLTAISETDGAVFLAGPAGSGKSTLARQVAKALGLTFYSMACNAMTTATDFLGFKDANGTYHRTPWRDAFEHGGLILVDEMDAAGPDVLVVVNGGMENGGMTFRDGYVTRHKDFRVIAGANTWGTGPDAMYQRNQLDAATLNRFDRLAMDYDRPLERAIALSYVPEDDDGTIAAQIMAWVDACHTIRDRINEHRLKVVNGMRDIRRGAQVIAQLGWEPRKVARMRFLAGLTDDQIAKVAKGTILA